MAVLLQKTPRKQNKEFAWISQITSSAPVLLNLIFWSIIQRILWPYQAEVVINGHPYMQKRLLKVAVMCIVSIKSCDLTTPLNVSFSSPLFPRVACVSVFVCLSSICSCPVWICISKNEWEANVWTLLQIRILFLHYNVIKCIQQLEIRNYIQHQENCYL